VNQGSGKYPKLSTYESLLDALLKACLQHYSHRLISVVVFGSVARGTPTPDSDLDFLIVADDLPNGRIKRVAEFAALESSLQSQLEALRSEGFTVELSPLFKTPAEARAGSLLFLDMIEDARLLFDRNGFFRATLEAFRARLDELGARRIWQGNAWYWDLKPDYRPGDIFEL
jgi:predicted nucleotidyltransferase